MRGDYVRTINYLNEVIQLTTNDLGADSDNTWTDGATVDAHVYTGWTYDYFFKRFGRRGLDNNDLPLVSLVHPVRRSDFQQLLPDSMPDFFTQRRLLRRRHHGATATACRPDSPLAARRIDFLLGGARRRGARTHARGHRLHVST